MNNRLQEAFEPIHATDQMKQNTCRYLQEEMILRQRKRSGLLRYAVTFCALLAVVLCGVGGYTFYHTPISFISVDVNPSVELTLNRFDRVISVTAFNDDGARVLRNLKLENRPYTDAIELLLSDQTFQRFLAEDSLLSFTVVSDKEEELLAGIKQCASYSKSESECHGAEEQLVEEAHHNGLSFGKYQAYLELQQYDNTITAGECKDMTMRQIRERISGYQNSTESPSAGEEELNTHDSGEEHGNGHGYHRGQTGGE